MSKGFHNNLLIVNTSNTKEINPEFQDDIGVESKDNESSNLERMSSIGNDVSHSLSKSFFDREKDGEVIPVLNEIDFPIDEHRSSLYTNQQPVKLLNKVPILEKTELGLVKQVTPKPNKLDEYQTADGRSGSTSLIEKESRKKTVWKDSGPSIEVRSLVYRIDFEPLIDQPANLHLETK